MVLTPSMKAFFLATAAAALLTSAAHADAIRSPFLPPNAPTGGSAGTTDPNAMELRGIMVTPEGTKYNIFDPGSKHSVWAGVNEQGNGFLIKSADTAKDEVTIAANGSQQTLSLKEAKVLTPAANGVPMGGAVLRPTPEDEQRRLQAVADEVRRRRLLREQAAQAQASGQPMPPELQQGPTGKTPKRSRGGNRGQ